MRDIKFLSCKLAIIIFLFLVSFLLTVVTYQASYAQLAVTDPGLLAQSKLDYIEMVNTVSELREQVQQTKNMILEAKQMKEGIGALRTEMSTIYNNTFGLIGELNRLREDILKTPQEIQSFMNEFKKNADCLFADMDKYAQVETMYKARYVFKDNYGGTPNYPGDDPYVWEDGSQMAGSFDPVQMKENPCGHSVTYYSELVQRVEQEKTLLDRIHGVWNKTDDEMKAEKRFYTEMEKKVEETKTEKETLDTMKAILWKMNSHLESIDSTILSVAGIVIGRIHDPNALLRAPGLSDKAKTLISANNIKLGVASEFNKKAAIWESLGAARKPISIR